jgi:hypothetical protein
MKRSSLPPLPLGSCAKRDQPNHVLLSLWDYVETFRSHRVSITPWGMSAQMQSPMGAFRHFNASAHNLSAMPCGQIEFENRIGAD